MGFFDAISSGIEGLGDVFGSALDFSTNILGDAGPLFGALSDFGVIGPGQGGGVMTNPAPSALAQQASMLPAVIGGVEAVGAVASRFNTFAPAARGIIGTGLVAEGIDLVQNIFGGESGGNGMSAGPLTINPVQGGGGVRYPRTVQAMVRTPSGNTRVVTYRNMGSPILYSGDLAAKKRVNKVRRRLGR